MHSKRAGNFPSFFVLKVDEIYKRNPPVGACLSSPKNRYRRILPVEIFSQSIYVFFHGELIKQITQGERIEKRDPLVKALLYPAFKKYWLEEIDSMDLSDSDQEGEKILDRTENRSLFLLN